MNINILNHAYENYREEKENLENEFNDNLNEAKKLFLGGLLEGIGFEGIDASIEESLFCYGTVKKDETLIMYIEDKGYYVQDISNEDMENALNDMDEGFYDFIGVTKEDYLKSYKTGQFNTMVIYDIRQYKDILTDITLYEDKPMNIDEIINFLENKYLEHYNTKNKDK